MSQVSLYTQTGKEKRKITLNKEIFSAPINERLLALVQKAFSANLRHGTASTKTRGEVRGGGKKPWRQKGTGRARHGSIRSPIWRGGGIAFGPRPRDYFVQLPQTMKEGALISALSLRVKEKNMFLLEEAKLKKPKTKEFVKILEALPLKKKRTLFVVKEADPFLVRSARNLSGLVEIKRAQELNAYHVLHWPKILIEETALGVLESRLLPAKEEPETPEDAQDVKGTKDVKDTK